MVGSVTGSEFKFTTHGYEITPDKTNYKKSKNPLWSYNEKKDTLTIYNPEGVMKGANIKNTLKDNYTDLIIDSGQNVTYTGSKGHDHVEVHNGYNVKVNLNDGNNFAMIYGDSHDCQAYGGRGENHLYIYGGYRNLIKGNPGDYFGIEGGTSNAKCIGTKLKTQ